MKDAFVLIEEERQLLEMQEKEMQPKKNETVKSKKKPGKQIKRQTWNQTS